MGDVTSCFLASCHFISNSCVGAAGAVEMTTGQIIDCRFESNSAVESGGALLTTGDARLKNSHFDANSAGNGGAIYSAGALTLQNASVSTCASSANGAAVYSTGETDISDTTLRDFSAPLAGNATIGVFYHASTDSSSFLTLRRVKFEDVQLLFVASLQPRTVVIYNCDLSAADVQLTSLLTCEDSATGSFCAKEYCSDVAAGIQVPLVTYDDHYFTMKDDWLILRTKPIVWFIPPSYAHLCYPGTLRSAIATQTVNGKTPTSGFRAPRVPGARTR